MLETVEPILKDRLQREDLPYRLVFGQVPWSGGQQDPNAPGFTGGRTGVDQTGGRTPFGGMQDRTGGSGFQQPGAVGGDPKQLAPLPGAPAERSGVQTVTITWYAVLPAASEGGDA
jgi:hypothetical protein